LLNKALDVAFLGRSRSAADASDPVPEAEAGENLKKKPKTLKDLVNSAVQHHLLPSEDYTTIFGTEKMEKLAATLPLAAQAHALILHQHRRTKRENKKTILASDAGISTMRSVQVYVDELPEIRPRSLPLTLASKDNFRVISPIEILAVKGYTGIGLQFLTPAARKQVASDTTPVACGIALLGCCASLGASFFERKD
jgi:hypothetical protein